VLNKSAFFNEFVVELPRPVKEVNNKLLESGLIGGYDLGIDYGFNNQMLIAVTEQRTKEEIDKFVVALEAIVNG
ncbi:glycine dehydrogenase, partial [Bacillus salipaludis]|nr:glycine dehydrogenase [Bacillus salipaludis]